MRGRWASVDGGDGEGWRGYWSCMISRLGEADGMLNVGIYMQMRVVLLLQEI